MFCELMCSQSDPSTASTPQDWAASTLTSADSRAAYQTGAAFMPTRWLPVLKLDYRVVLSTHPSLPVKGMEEIGVPISTSSLQKPFQASSVPKFTTYPDYRHGMTARPRMYRLNNYILGKRCFQDWWTNPWLNPTTHEFFQRQNVNKAQVQRVSFFFLNQAKLLWVWNDVCELTK